MTVPRLGPKAFEQCAGFLRIRGGDDPLDASGVHPESYPVVRRILAKTSADVAALIGDTTDAPRLSPAEFTDEAFGLPTVNDILKELEKPGRDPRPEFRTATFAEGVHTLDDLEPGMMLEGVVTNVAAFGAFVDIGVHQDGLVHVSAMSAGFVADPRVGRQARRRRPREGPVGRHRPPAHLPDDAPGRRCCKIRRLPPWPPPLIPNGSPRLQTRPRFSSPWRPPRRSRPPPRPHAPAARAAPGNDRQGARRSASAAVQVTTAAAARAPATAAAVQAATAAAPAPSDRRSDQRATTAAATWHRSRAAPIRATADGGPRGDDRRARAPDDTRGAPAATTAVAPAP